MHVDHPKLIKRVKRPSTAFDRLVVLIAFVYPLSAIPQVVAVFEGKTDGVSILSWAIFLVCACLLLTYGLKHKVPPMIIGNSLWIVMDVLILGGLLLHFI